MKKLDDKNRFKDNKTHFVGKKHVFPCMYSRGLKYSRKEKPDQERMWRWLPSHVALSLGHLYLSPGETKYSIVTYYIGKLCSTYSTFDISTSFDIYTLMN